MYDYTPMVSPSSGKISASNTSSTHEIIIHNDNITESNEVFYISIVIMKIMPPSAKVNVLSNETTIQIIDDDGEH